MSAPRTVRIVADLASRHGGRTIRLPDLHQPGQDFDAPRVTVVGRYYGKRLAATGWWWLDVRLRSGGSLQLDTPLPDAHPCYLVGEDGPARLTAEPVALFGEEA